MSTPATPIELSRLFCTESFSLPLQKRLNLTVDKLGRNPQLSLPQALGSAGYKGLMRALNNPKVKQSDLLDAVYASTLGRIAPGEDVLCIEDTTDLIFGGQRGRKDLPRLEGKATGFRAHIALAVRADATRSVLGVLDLRQVVREQQTKASQTAAERYADPAKESVRWQQTVDTTEKRIAGRASLVHVRDREGDDYEQLTRMAVAGQRFVQRMRQARRLAEAPADAPNARKIDEAFEGVCGRCEREVTLSARAQGKSDPRPNAEKKRFPARRQRNARLQFAALPLVIRRPENASSELPDSLKLNVVHVAEVDVLDGQEPVEWYLLTQEPIDTVEQVLRVVDIYRARWLIEEFNKGLQTGCQYEKLQCESPERLWSMLAFYCPIVTNLLALRTLARREENAPADTVLDPAEIAVLEEERKSTERGTALTVRRALLLVAKLGGHFSHNGEPGWLVLLRGAVTMHERAQGYRMAFAHLAQSAAQPDPQSNR